MRRWAQAARMLKDEARKVIEREWMELPREERWTRAQVYIFSIKMSQRYDFKTSGGRSSCEVVPEFGTGGLIGGRSAPS